MRYADALANLAIGSVYTGYGFMTLREAAPRWFRRQPIPHFALAWLTMTFTCGPHHLAHGLHLLVGGRAGGGWELAAVLVGAPAGVTWFLLRIEAMRGGQGDRWFEGTPAKFRIGVVAITAATLVLIGGLLVELSHGATFNPRLSPNVLLIVLYVMIGYYLGVAQISNWRSTGRWSVSGLALTVVFPTCAVMHGAWMVYASTGLYAADAHGRVIDWLAVPSAIYFVWVVRAIARGALRDDDGMVVPLPAWLAIKQPA
jgi:hypothetical protein